jgi:hypothetical protein
MSRVAIPVRINWWFLAFGDRGLTFIAVMVIDSDH